MRRTWSVVATALVVVVSLPATLLAQPDFVTVGPMQGEQDTIPLAIQSAGPAPAALNISQPGAAQLYNNTEICTIDMKGLAVGGSTSYNPPLSTLDWFTSSGGHVVGFDLFVVNGGAGAVANHMQITFYEGSDAQNVGTPSAQGFRSTGTPTLSPVPVYTDPVTGAPRVMRVSVDYVKRTYSIVDAETLVPLISPSEQDIGFRRSLQIPPGKSGIDVRFMAEKSICAGGSPKCGVVLAGGGSGNENGLHIPNAVECVPARWEVLCDNPDWFPEITDPESPRFGERIPCTGLDICSLNEPYFGIALVLYVGAGEDANGNNEKVTADEISLDLPSPPGECSGTFTTVGGFIGDSPVSFTFTENVRLFDCDSRGDGTGPLGDPNLGEFEILPEVNLLDYACFQRCFDRLVFGDCDLQDQNINGIVDDDDLFGFVICSSIGPDDPSCIGRVPDPPVLLADVDLHKITGLASAAGKVLSVLVTGDKSGGNVPNWDPYLKIFQDVGGELVPLEVSDDYERFSFDAFTTVKVPQGVSNLYVGISAAENKNYPTDNPSAIPQIAPDQAGGYSLTLGLTDPNCVTDPTPGSAFNSCYNKKHEPDDNMTDATTRGGLCEPETAGCTLPHGMIGDGAFASLGQDFDMYRIKFFDANNTGPRRNTRSLTLQVVGPPGNGFETEFDLAMAFYDSAGELLATGDQSRQGQLAGDDQSRPQLAATRLKGEGKGVPPGDGIYYLAIFGTDRGLFDNACNFIFPAIPPSLVNFPHGVSVAATSESDLRPTLGGRVNRPDGRILGCTTDPVLDPPATQQCYRINVMTFTQNEPPGVDVSEFCELFPGNDSIGDACLFVNPPVDRLAGLLPENFVLGDGIFGGFQGDVDFYQIQADPGDLIVVNVADVQHPELDYNNVRTYLALYDSNGYIFALHDYSLEHFDGTAIFDDIGDETASVLAGVMPPGIGPTAYLMVGIDNGNLLQSENTPFDASKAGTTLSRRYETQTPPTPRDYGVGVAVMSPLQSLSGKRVFVVPKRGIDDVHTSCNVTPDSPLNFSRGCFPSIIEIDPITGQTLKVFEGGIYFSTFLTPLPATFPNRKDSTNPLIAYDGDRLWISIELCADVLCGTRSRRLFSADPDKQPTETGFMTSHGSVFGIQNDDQYRGLAEVGGFLYMFNDTDNTFRFWDKASPPASANGGTITPTPTDENADPRWNQLYGDIGSDGTKIYVGCYWQEWDDQVPPNLISEGEYGICAFTPDRVARTMTFNGKLADPTTNLAFIPGPRLGGLDVIAPDMVITSDFNGPIVQYWTGWSLTDPAMTGTIKALELPREFQAARLTARAALP